MDYGRIARLSLLMFALAGIAQAADKATLADAAKTPIVRAESQPQP